MLPVVTHAQPAELVTALYACHVHAPTVFLDVGLAFGAGFRIKLDPLLIGIRAQVRLIQPLL